MDARNSAFTASMCCLFEVGECVRGENYGNRCLRIGASGFGGLDSEVDVVFYAALCKHRDTRSIYSKRREVMTSAHAHATRGRERKRRHCHASDNERCLSAAHCMHRQSTRRRRRAA